MGNMEMKNTLLTKYQDNSSSFKVVCDFGNMAANLLRGREGEDKSKVQSSKRG
jgi:hypothetical protein